MAVREIIRMGHPNLRVPASPFPVADIASPAFESLIADMQETLHAYGGIGLAAPQIDVSLRVVVIEIENTRTRYGEIQQTPFEVYVNPVITPIEPESAGYWEACLSVPGLMGYVERPQHIRVDYTNREGKSRSLEAHGFLATVFQHEFDHLDGVLYIDRISDLSLLSFDKEYLTHHAGIDDAGALPD